MKSTQYYPVLMTDRVADTARFYEQHFRFTRQFDSDWYVNARPVVTMQPVDAHSATEGDVTLNRNPDL